MCPSSTRNSKPMPRISEILEQCKWLVEHGRADEPGHLVLPGVENRRRIKKPGKRFALGADEDIVKRLLIQKERYLSAMPKAMALELMCSLWEAPTREQL